MKLFESDVIVIEHDTDMNAIVMTWKPAYLKSELYREALEQGLKAVKENKCEKWLANLKDMKLIALADEKWTNESWFPRALESSLKWMAIIVSNDVFNKVSVNKIMKADKVKMLTTDYFQSVDDAKKWLKSKEMLAA